MIVVGALAMGTSSCNHKPADVITDDNKICADVNGSLKDYKVKHTDDLTSSDPANITGYFRDDEVKKIYTERFGSKNRTFTEYYFDEGMLICVRVQNFVYNRPNTYNEEVAKHYNDSEWYDDKKTKLETSTYYFTRNNKMIKWIDAGKDISATSPDFINKQSEVWAQAVILIKELRESDS